SRRPGNAAETPAARWRRSRCPSGTRWRARTWCPDRWRGRRTWVLLPGRFFVGERTADWGDFVNMRKAEAIHSDVIASEAKQSSFLAATRKLDCFVASLLAMTVRLRRRR